MREREHTSQSGYLCPRCHRWVSSEEAHFCFTMSGASCTGDHAQIVALLELVLVELKDVKGKLAAMEVLPGSP